jgi:hypothetical protein
LSGSGRRVKTTFKQEAIVLLIVAIILLVLFAGLGFVAHVLWLGLILAVIVGVAASLTRGRA